MLVREGPKWREQGNLLFVGMGEATKPALSGSIRDKVVNQQCSLPGRT